MDPKITGRLYGIGVGPGESGLITLKAVEILRKIKTVFVPRSADEKASLALEISRPHLPPGCKVAELLFPMTKDKDDLAKHWDRAAGPVAAAMAAGEDCGFLTLGDPMLFSTYIYLVRAVRALAPTAAIESVPGISAAFAAASKSVLPLAEGSESIAVITGDRLASLASIAGMFETIIIMKVGKRLPEINAALRRLGLDRSAVLAHRVGLAGELICDADAVEDDQLGYLSTIIVRTRR
ncbi:MAG: precorrin-2 C(20)-methyltransferase [Actinomycetota bacterium]|nr:precorrin-2 C(20)-methyltransferase [Actinomycetota bacterium]